MKQIAINTEQINPSPYFPLPAAATGTGVFALLCAKNTKSTAQYLPPQQISLPHCPSKTI
jgi:hypothetical protein